MKILKKSFEIDLTVWKFLKKIEKLDNFGFMEASAWLIELDLWKTIQSLWKPSNWLDWTLFDTCAVLLGEKRRDRWTIERWYLTELNTQSTKCWCGGRTRPELAGLTVESIEFWQD